MRKFILHRNVVGQAKFRRRPLCGTRHYSADYRRRSPLQQVTCRYKALHAEQQLKDAPELSDASPVFRCTVVTMGAPVRFFECTDKVPHLDVDSVRSLTGTSFAVAYFARMMMPLLFLGDDWTANERVEIHRLEKFCEASDDWLLECSHTDAGDPWCVVYDERHQRSVVHIARLERRLVVVMPRAQRVVYTTSMTAAVEMALNELRSHGP
jgi:hypothetical protein